ncbi:hypothetical protein VHA_001062 [Grimontia hollisae CIP 101886]|uniref:Uncharacterized protein n=1 Tax=Grimontia hollisae CIP 101886 TaxID=675812 RepID=D0I5P5_GRIHO|nr:hypothetical protein VHA_001062 [Grimontia hollisae CIP 101886]
MKNINFRESVKIDLHLIEIGDKLIAKQVGKTRRCVIDA